MYPYFWCGTTIKNFLFYGYDIFSIATLLVTCLGLLVLGIGMEWLGLVQAKIRHKELVERQEQLRRICPSESDSFINQEPSTSAQANLPILTKKTVVLRFFYDLGLWLSQQCVGYVLMLSVMVYNVYIVIAIVLGYALGYFLFGQKAVKMKLKNCQVKRDTFCMSDCGDPDRCCDADHRDVICVKDPICKKSQRKIVKICSLEEVRKPFT